METITQQRSSQDPQHSLKQFTKELQKLTSPSQVDKFLQKFCDFSNISHHNLNCDVNQFIDRKLKQYKENCAKVSEIQQTIAQLDNQISLRKNTIRNLLVP